MFERKYTKPDGAKVTEKYESWYETTLTQGYIGLVFTFVGLVALVTLPFLAVYRVFWPNLISYGEHKECLSWERDESKSAASMPQSGQG
jgi:hypothetical protein